MIGRLGRSMLDAQVYMSGVTLSADDDCSRIGTAVPNLPLDKVLVPYLIPYLTLCDVKSLSNQTLMPFSPIALFDIQRIPAV